MIANFKIWGQKIYIFTFHIINITQSAVFSSKISMIANVILFFYNRSIKIKLISRDLLFIHHIACLCCISPTKNNFKQLQHSFASLSNMTYMIRFSHNDSLVNSDLLPPTGVNFTFKVYFHFLNNFKYKYSMFCLKRQIIYF